MCLDLLKNLYPCRAACSSDGGTNQATAAQLIIGTSTTIITSRKNSSSRLQGRSRFCDKVGAIAEEQGHHPDIYLAWEGAGKDLDAQIDGLTESDFILAAKSTRLSDTYLITDEE